MRIYLDIWRIPSGLHSLVFKVTRCSVNIRYVCYSISTKIKVDRSYGNPTFKTILTFVGDVCSPNVKEPVPKQNICNTVLWLILHHRGRTPNPIVTLYYAQLFPLVQIRIWIPVWIVSWMVTVPIFRMDLCPRDPNPNPSTLVEMSHYGLITLSDFDTDTDSEPNRVNPSMSPVQYEHFLLSTM